ncbi:ZN777 protein, partial [Locustella ochotensis]|nr:ZN777 protein [Locustella ochotensis]
EPEQTGNVAQKSGNLVEDSKNLVEKSRSPVEISGNLTEENRSPAEESGNLMEESRSPADPENCSKRECLANPAAAARGPGSLPGCSLPPFMAALVLTALVPLDLSRPTPLPPHPLSVHCWEAVGQNCSPPAAGEAEARIATEVPQEQAAAEKPSLPKTPPKGLEEDKGVEEEAVKDSGNTGQDLVADIAEEAGKEVTPAVCRTTQEADPGPGEAEKDSCTGRPAACQRNAPREFYSCPICRKTFLLKINLLIHQRGHTNWVPYVCVHCDRKFMSKKKIRRHLRAWAANGTCQPSELEVCPSQVPCSASHPQTWAANGPCQASKPEECPSRTPCPTSQPQNWAPNGSCQPSDA